MNRNKTFTLKEAQALLPSIKQMLASANAQLSKFEERLEKETLKYETIEKRMAEEKASSDAADMAEFRNNRREFQSAIHDLSIMKQEYVDLVGDWVEKITKTGVILRDIQSGLIDFPARKGKIDYYLCWRLGENDIDHWHLIDDGFVGRRPLSVLDEYF